MAMLTMGREGEGEYVGHEFDWHPWPRTFTLVHISEVISQHLKSGHNHNCATLYRYSKNICTLWRGGVSQKLAEVKLKCLRTYKNNTIPTIHSLPGERLPDVLGEFWQLHLLDHGIV